MVTICVKCKHSVNISIDPNNNDNPITYQCNSKHEEYSFVLGKVRQEKTVFCVEKNQGECSDFKEKDE